MRGPYILARSISASLAHDSDRGHQSLLRRHRSIAGMACGAFLLDLMVECYELRSTVASGRIGLSFNQILRGPANTRVDLVVWMTRSSHHECRSVTFSDLLCCLGVSLASEESALVSDLPSVIVNQSPEASEMMIALDTRLVGATQHTRLRAMHASILATNYLVKRASPQCIAASYVLVDSADQMEPPANQGPVDQVAPMPAGKAVVQRLFEALPRRVPGDPFGLDAIGATWFTRADDSLDIVVQTPTDDTETALLAGYPKMIRSISNACRLRLATIEKDQAGLVRQPAVHGTCARSPAAR